MSNSLHKNLQRWILLALMVSAALFARALTPHAYLADQRAKVDLEQLIPSTFGNWRELKQFGGQIVNPQQKELLEKIYSQTLSRTYVDQQGVAVMLSIAYGANQSRGVALHYPEVCYPAQGFQLHGNSTVEVSTKFGAISGRQLITQLGQRKEPVTYWSTLGDKVVRGGINTRLAQLEYGFNGLIPDGLIFRVSSISNDTNKAHLDQTRFVNDLIEVLPPAARMRLAGLSS